MHTATDIDQWSKLSEGARYRLSVIGVPKLIINQMVDDVFKWLKLSGVEWTVKRLKALKLSCIHQAANTNIALIPWVRKNKSGQYYGWIGCLFRWCQNKGNMRSSQRRFARVIQALNISTLFTSQTVTVSQLDKFLKGVNCIDDCDWDYEFYSSFLSHVKRTIGKRTISRNGNSCIEYRGSPSKKAPLPHNMGSCPQDQQILSERRWFEGKENYIFGWEYNELYAPVFAAVDGPLEKTVPIITDEYMYGGEVHFLQEPGLKMRAIASPYRLHQLALKPLGDAIYRIVEESEWDCTYNQSKALPRIQDALLRGEMVYSIDLTGATDYFPLGLQLDALREIFGEVIDINLLRDISQMRFKSQHGDIQWKRGQPLGLYPSFGMFTLTHGLVLHFLAKGDATQFYVLGDDVVILNTNLYNEYIKFLDLSHCPWSKEKSINSNSIAEFAGKIITPYSIIPQYKWRMMSNDNFLDICTCLGARSRVLLTDRQKEVFDAVKHLLPPLGLNISKPGGNLAEMIIETERFVSRINRAGVRTLVDLIPVINKNSYSSPVPYQLNNEVIQEVRQTFDVKVCLVYQQTVFAQCQALWKMVSDIPRALDLKPRLPNEQSSPTRVSTLIRYEDLLRLHGM